MRRLLVLLLALGACAERGHPGAAKCDPPRAEIECVSGRDPAACQWLQTLTASLSDDELRELFPLLAGKALVDAPVPDFEGLAMSFKSYAPFPVTVPVDWTANPYTDTWQLELQSLSWLRHADDAAAAAVLVDWSERAMTRTPPLTWAWDDAAMSKRLHYAVGFLESYAATGPTLNRRVVVAAARIILTHLYALSSNACYAGKNNHGMMENIAVLQNAHVVASRADLRALWDRTVERTVAHVEKSVTADGIHVEHSPDYQLLYLGLVLDAIDAIGAAGAPVPPPLIVARDGLVEGIAFTLQPNHTFPQFGDTENTDWTVRLERAVQQARAQPVGDPRALDHLEWVLSDGAKGAPPAALDRVFERGGLASFRSGWGTDAVTAHFIASRLSDTHYHQDDGTFEIFAAGREVVIDTGKRNYDRGAAETAATKRPAAHNVLTVDGDTFRPTAPPAIVAHGESGDAAWAEAAFANYTRRGVSAQVRWFAYARPDAFVVLDELDSGSAHDLVQHLHLHPSLTRVEAIGDGVVRATDATGGASLFLVAATPATVSIAPAVYYPAWETSEADVEVTFAYRSAPGHTALPLLLLLGSEPPTGVAFDPDTRTLRWTQAGRAREVEL